MSEKPHSCLYTHEYKKHTSSLKVSIMFINKLNTAHNHTLFTFLWTPLQLFLPDQPCVHSLSLSLSLSLSFFLCHLSVSLLGKEKKCSRVKHQLHLPPFCSPEWRGHEEFCQRQSHSGISAMPLPERGILSASAPCSDASSSPPRWCQSWRKNYTQHQIQQKFCLKIQYNQYLLKKKACSAPSLTTTTTTKDVVQYLWCSSFILN